MYVLEVENEVGERLRLTQNESRYQVLKVDGLLPPKANIVTSSIATMDGERYKSSRLEMRNIVIQVKICGQVEKNRIALYHFFDSGRPLKIYYRNGTRNVYCHGYCEEPDGDLFENGQTLQVSIVCPEPYWRDVATNEYELSFTSGQFEFPFSIDSTGIEFSSYTANNELSIVNIGDVRTGMKISLFAKEGTVSRPAIYNVNTRERFELNTSLNDSEEIRIDTNRGNRKIVKIVDGVEYDIFTTLEFGSSWLQLNRALNVFTFGADSGDEFLTVRFGYEIKYKGV